MRRHLRGVILISAIALAIALPGCRKKPNPPDVPPVPPTAQAPVVKPAVVQPFNFEIALGPNHYQIEGYVVKSPEAGRLPAVLVLNGDEGDALQCVKKNGDLATILDIQVACVSIPGYGKSSGPSRLVGPQAVEAARRAFDLLAERGDVDPNRVAVWGVADGAVAAGLLMDYDKRPRSLILQSGAYDMVKLWPEAPFRHQAENAARGMAEQARAEGTQRHRESARQARLQCPHHAWRERSAHSAAPGGQTRRRAAGPRRARLDRILSATAATTSRSRRSCRRKISCATPSGIISRSRPPDLLTLARWARVASICMALEWDLIQRASTHAIQEFCLRCGPSGKSLPKAKKNSIIARGRAE